MENKVEDFSTPSGLKQYWGTVKAEAISGWMRWGSFAAIWIWCCIGMRFPSFEPTELLSTWNFSYMGCVSFGLVVSLTCVLVFSSKIISILDSKFFHAVVTVALLAGSIVSYAGSAFLGSFEVTIAGAFVSGAAIGLLKVAWGELFSRMDTQKSIIDLGIALIVSTIIVLILGFGSQEMLAIFYFACAIIPSYLLYGGRKSFEAKEAPSEQSAGTVKLSWSFLVIPGLIALSHGLLQTYSASMAATNVSLDFVLVLSEMLAGIVLLFMIFRYPQDQRMVKLYSMSLALAVIGFFGFIFVPGFEGLGLVLNNFGFSVFYFFMIAYWGSLSRLTNKPIVQVYAYGYLGFQLANFAGIFIASMLIGSTVDSTWQSVAFIVVSAFVVSIVFFLGDRSSQVHSWLMPTVSFEDESSKQEQACRDLAEEFQLTPRELEVLFYLAKGRTSSYIGKKLVVSPETARTHIKNIYAKTDIHGQQELMDAVETLAGKE